MRKRPQQSSPLVEAAQILATGEGDRSEAARILNASRKHPRGGRPRTIKHKPDNPKCPCRACDLGRMAKNAHKK